MRSLLLVLPLLSLFGCVAKDSANPPTSSEPQAEPLIRSFAESDSCELAYLDKATVVRLLQDWGRRNGQGEPFADEAEPPFKNVFVEEIAGKPEHFVAICDTIPQWWGVACCLRISSGRIEKLWVLEDQDEQSMRTVTSEYVIGPRGGMPIIVALGHTHQGHGSLYLYEYLEDGPRLILETPAVDSHMDGDLYRGGALTPHFDDLNKSGCFEVTLLGIRDHYEAWADESAPVRSEIVLRTYVYDVRVNKLVEDMTRRIGQAHSGDG